MNVTPERGRTHHYNMVANGLVSDRVPATGLFNGTSVCNGCKSTATGIGSSKAAGVPNGAKPQHMVNGYVNHGYKVKITKAAPPRTPIKQAGTIPAVSDATAAVRVSNGDGSNGVSDSEAISLVSVDGPGCPEPTVPGPNLSAAAKQQRRRRRKFRSKKRDTEVKCWANSTPTVLMPPREAEDWEKESQEVTAANWEKMFIRPYGPEDVLQFALQKLTLKRQDSADVSVSADYTPAAHHPHPVRWCCHDVSPDPDQFEDADE